jgi:hypothetical protein
MAIARLLALFLAVAAGCAPRSVVPLSEPTALQSLCSGTYVPRLSAIQNILTSLRDGGPTPASSPYPRLVANAKAKTGVVAIWGKDPAQVVMPQEARALGEADQYMRVKRVVIANAPEGADPPRPIDVEVRDHGTYRWLTFTAYDTQNVCVEGQRAF